SSGIVALADRQQLLGPGVEVLDPNRNLFTLIVTVIAMTPGAVLGLRMRELITEKGIGNGMSVLIFAGIATRLPTDGMQILQNNGGLVFAMVALGVVVLVIGITFIEQGQRRIPVQYAKRMVGRRQYGGSST